jgi:hypothetical protein
MSIATRRLMTVTASTKRSPVISGGKRGDPATNIASLKCQPLDPVDAELRERLALETPHALLQTFAAAADILTGDILVVSSVENPIRKAESWGETPAGGDGFLWLVLG